MLEEDLSRLEVGEIIYFSCEKGYCFWGVSLVKCLFMGDLEGIGLWYNVKVSIIILVIVK